MPTSPNEDGRPTAGGAALPVHIMNPGSISGGGGGGSSSVAVTNFPASQAVTIADGADVAEGATSAAAVTDPTLSGTTIGLLKGLLTVLGATTGAAVITNAVGSIQQYLRGLVTLWIAGLAAGEAHIGAVGGNSNKILVTPTLTVAATYVSGDYVGTSGAAMVFAGAGRVAAGTGVILSATFIDYALQSVACELWLFTTAITPPADSAAWSISDADALNLVTVIPFSTYYASALNSVAPAKNIGDIYKCAGGDTNLYGCIVTRGAPTYANGNVNVVIKVLQD